MPRKAVSKTESKQVTQPEKPQAKVAQAEKKAPAPKRQTKKEETVVESTVPQETTKGASTTRHVPTRDSVEQEFNDLVRSIDEEINKLRDSNGKTKGSKFLRTVNKRLKTLKTHTLRVVKQKPTTRRNNTNSGFKKPVQISGELAKFAGWNPSELKSRVDVTKFICNYIKEHNLQNTEDRRNIRIDEDPKLKNLLGFDGKDKKPLTYYSLQTYLKKHFVA